MKKISRCWNRGTFYLRGCCNTAHTNKLPSYLQIGSATHSNDTRGPWPSKNALLSYYLRCTWGIARNRSQN